MDIGRAFSQAWKLFVKDIAALIIGIILAALLSIVSLGILFGPTYGSLLLAVIRRVREGRPMEFGDVFLAFDRFGTLFLAALVLAILLAIGYVLLIVPGLLLTAIWFYVFPLIVDKGMGLGEAMSESKRLVMKNGFGLHIAIVIIVGLATSIVSGITGGVGWLLSGPLTITFLIALYFAAQGDEAALVAACEASDTVRPTLPTAPSPPPAPAVVVPPADSAIAVDPATGHSTPHCSQCGAALESSSDFCGVCGVQMSGGHDEGVAAAPVTVPPPPAPPAPPQPPAEDTPQS
jgi:hypothetical protein